MNPTQNTPAPQAKTPAALLRSAADYLNTHGWHQGGLYAPATDGTGRLRPACAIGALHYAAHGRPFNGDNPDAWFALTDPAITALGEYLEDAPPWDRDTLPDYRLMVAEWNDDQHTTLGHVLDVLAAAADRWTAHHPAATPSAALPGGDLR